MGRRSVVVLGLGTVMGLGQACGLDAGLAVTGGGSGQAGGTEGTSESEETTVAADDGTMTGTSGGLLQCSDSDLPPPFCHRRLAIPIAETTEIVGRYPDPDPETGLHPVILVDNDKDRFALADPTGDGDVLQAFIPVDLRPLWVTIVAGDLTHDGVPDLVFVPVGLDVGPVIVLDGETLDEVAQLETDPTTVFNRGVGLMDVNGDGLLELVTADDRQLMSSIVEAWSLSSGSFEKVFSFDTEVNFPPTGWPRRLLIADITGDALLDFSLAWGGGARPFLPEQTPTITTLVAPSRTGDVPLVVESSQPVTAVRADAADMDNDGTAEVVIAESVSAVYVLDWNGEGLETTEVITLPSGYEPNALGKLNAGRLSGNGFGGVFLGAILRRGDNPEASLFGALFASGSEPRLVERDGDFIADFNGDGVDDFFASGEFFLSLGAAD